MLRIIIEGIYSVFQPGSVLAVYRLQTETMPLQNNVESNVFFIIILFPVNKKLL
jgi:hypothetical protein